MICSASPAIGGCNATNYDPCGHTDAHVFKAYFGMGQWCGEDMELVDDFCNFAADALTCLAKSQTTDANR